MNKFLSNIVSQFGFSDFTDFANSMIHSKLLAFTFPSAALLYTLVESWFGFTAAVFTSFLLLAMLELISGVWAAKIRKEQIQSRKFGRFGFKLFVWLILIFVANSLKMSYYGKEDYSSLIIYQTFSWLHGVTIVYVAFEYIISVIENVSCIMGKPNNKLLNFLKKRMDKVLGDEGDSSKEKKSEENISKEN